MIKLIVSDIDGTLVKDGENQINPEIFDVIMELKKKKKIHFAAASGRQAASIEYTFSPIKKEIFYVAENATEEIFFFIPLSGRLPIPLQWISEKIRSWK